MCVSDVFELCEYHAFFKELVARLCREYSKSGKRKKNLEELAKQIIGAKAFKLHIVIDLSERAKVGFVLSAV